MRVFLTGATGFIGSAIVPELINAGHQVLGLTRSDAGAQSLIAAGAEVHRGSLEDPESLRSGAAQSDGVIHCAFDHSAFGGNDFSKFLEVCEKDRRAIDALGDALSRIGPPNGNHLRNRNGERCSRSTRNRRPFRSRPPESAQAIGSRGAAVSERGVNVSVVRLPQVHDTVKQGLITYAVQVAREKGVSACIGEGLNRWPAAHVLDVARLYRLALEKHEAGSRYNAVAEEGVSMREIAEVIGRGLKVPVVSLSQQEAQAHFGWLAMFVSYDMPASSAQTRQRLGWHPTGPGLIADLEQMRWPQAVTH